MNWCPGIMYFNADEKIGEVGGFSCFCILALKAIGIDKVSETTLPLLFRYVSPTHNLFGLEGLFDFLCNSWRAFWATFLKSIGGLFFL
jgi:hypothetical protein